MGAAVAVAGLSGVAGPRGAGQSEAPNPPVPGARVKQDQEMVAGPPPATAELGPDTLMPDGAAGLRPDPPHAAAATDAVMITRDKYDLISPLPRVRRQRA